MVGARPPRRCWGGHRPHPALAFRCAPPAGQPASDGPSNQFPAGPPASRRMGESSSTPSSRRPTGIASRPIWRTPRFMRWGSRTSPSLRSPRPTTLRSSWASIRGAAARWRACLGEAALLSPLLRRGWPGRTGLRRESLRLCGTLVRASRWNTPRRQDIVRSNSTGVDLRRPSLAPRKYPLAFLHHPTADLIGEAVVIDLGGKTRRASRRWHRVHGTRPGPPGTRSGTRRETSCPPPSKQCLPGVRSEEHLQRAGLQSPCTTFPRMDACSWVKATCERDITFLVRERPTRARLSWGERGLSGPGSPRMAVWRSSPGGIHEP